MSKGTCCSCKGEGQVLGLAQGRQQEAPALHQRPWPGPPHLLLEQGLDDVLPVPDALAQLCLLDELLRGGDEELLEEEQGLLPLCRAHRPAPPPALTWAYHVPPDQLLVA